MICRLCWLLVLLAACGGEASEATSTPAAGPAPQASPNAAAETTLRLYTSVTQDTVDAVVAAYRRRSPHVEVDVFRAPTGELNARIAAEQRSGGIRADVLWLTDPLSMQQYEAEGLLAPLNGPHLELRNADAVPAAYRSEASIGTRILNMIIVHTAGLDPAPASWWDLADPVYAGQVAIPDPAFAGSAFGALGYFALSDAFGLEFYRSLADIGAVQVQAPGEVTNGVAEGRLTVGMTLAQSAREAADKGSPVELVIPAPGAIAIYSPIAILATVTDQQAAVSLVDFVLTPEAQQEIAATGWEPIRDDVDWPHDYRQVAPDWPEISDRQDELLEQYRAIWDG